ncbi:hypothetical protein NP493_376g04042 [Ridgeia piscesae]|uniref:Uncharacterized protein n=1 Tax=Ridgeia piscesae TaxID=27915 RepID=A0AAD9L230_RIDPI|nr:hypothetical protein NP493_376g04042 [Ridgeia piscesae]
MKGNTVVVCSLVLFVILLQESIASHMGCVDHSVNMCQNILQPHHCYDARNRAICCATCRRFRTSDPACPYGDRNTVIKRDHRSYTCRGYVGHFGRTRCSDFEFYRLCCGSCLP